MRIGYLECFAGISGDMLLGALVGAGVPPALLAETAASLNLGATLSFESVDRSGISARKARVLVGGREVDAPGDHSHPHEHDHDHHHDHSHSHDHGPTPSHSHPHSRNLPAIREILNHAPLPAQARALALRAFELLGQAEAAIHNVPLDQVHFHEVGAVDAIIDITCAAVGLTSLAVDRWYSSPVNAGSGFVECAHGRFPVPAPATASLLRGIPTYSEGPAM
ncbi:MAG: LarC family nickel insertion protein, partial [Acidobacteriaceae bacterium]